MFTNNLNVQINYLYLISQRELSMFTLYVMSSSFVLNMTHDILNYIRIIHET
jgi:hypothetical protein